MALVVNKLKFRGKSGRDFLSEKERESVALHVNNPNFRVKVEALVQSTEVNKAGMAFP